MKSVTLYKRGIGLTLITKEFKPDPSGKLPKDKIDDYRRQGWTKTKPIIDEHSMRYVR